MLLLLILNTRQSSQETALINLPISSISFDRDRPPDLRPADLPTFPVDPPLPVIISSRWYMIISYSRLSAGSHKR